MSIPYTASSVGGMLAERRAAKAEVSELRRQLREREREIVDLWLIIHRAGMKGWRE